uniref:Carboxypeptidase n=1 Tax=Kalanchoe fedtschenkoi TaxID=63787 RepID=A0A7N0UC05_KALFE
MSGDQRAAYHSCRSDAAMALIKLLTLFLVLFTAFLRISALTSGTADGSEQWGYVQVRPKAHLFWWLYKSPFRVDDPANPWPTILWLQGGPGASGVAFGNFVEIGPLDANLEPRNSTWLRKADLLFVDSPVGTGFSYVDDVNLAVKTDEDSATDLTTLLKALFNGDEALQKNPLYIFAESYGGKFAVTLGVAALKAIEAGELKAQLGGVALGDSWISPEDFAFAWAPLLKDLSRMDETGLNISNSWASKIQQQLAAGEFADATQSWATLEGVISQYSNDVDFYNFMLDAADEPTDQAEVAVNRYTLYLNKKLLGGAKSGADAGGIESLMNGPIRDKLMIIPPNVSWGGQGAIVFPAMEGDFMRPRIQGVDELLAKGVNVTIYNGQVDLICCTKGVELWLKKLKWDSLKEFLSKDRKPLYCGDGGATKGFVSSHKNLFFYWILGAGHFVPVDQPCVSLEMVGNVTRSPSLS